MTILTIIVAFAVAVLAGLGVGGGGLLVLYLTLVLSTPQLQAQGANMLFFVAASGASMLIHVRKRKIDWHVVAICAAFALVGAYFGSQIAAAMETNLLRRIFGGFLVMSGVIVLFRRRKTDET